MNFDTSSETVVVEKKSNENEKPVVDLKAKNTNDDSIQVNKVTHKTGESAPKKNEALRLDKEVLDEEEKKGYEQEEEEKTNKENLRSELEDPDILKFDELGIGSLKSPSNGRLLSSEDNYNYPKKEESKSESINSLD